MNFNDLLNREEQLLEKRVKTRHLEDIQSVVMANTPYVIISGWTGEYSSLSINELSENVAADRKLQSMLNSKGFDFILTVTYAEGLDNETGKVTKQEKDSIFVINMSKTEGRILASRFDQDFIIFGDSEIGYLLDVKNNSKDKLGKFRPNMKGSIYTALRQNKSKVFRFG